MKSICVFGLTLLSVLSLAFEARAEAPVVLKGTSRLELSSPLDEVMVAGINKFALKAIAESRQNRLTNWPVDFTSIQSHAESVQPLREEFKKLIGVVDERVAEPAIELISTLTQSSLIATTGNIEIHRVRWPVLKGVTGEGLLLLPRGEIAGNVIALPDADWTPEQLCGLTAGVPQAGRFPLYFAARGYRVLVPTLINREQTHSGHPDVFYTNQPHREFIYRQAFELGRHLIGFEVQKVLAGIDAFDLLDKKDAGEQTKPPQIVAGIGEGGLLALYSAAIDTRIDQTICAGYFNQREQVWEEPIYRNVWGLLTNFGDAQLAGMIAPRKLTVINNAAPEISGPPTPNKGHRSTAAPGAISSPGSLANEEIKLAEKYFQKLGKQSQFTSSKDVSANCITESNVDEVTTQNGSTSQFTIELTRKIDAKEIENRQQNQFNELANFSQGLLDESHKVRNKLWKPTNRKTPEKWAETSDEYKKMVEEELIGKIDLPLMAPNVRTRKILENEHFVGYEVVLDVFPEVIAGGILLVPHHIQAGEKRPVVVCQHGLEGKAMDCISTVPDRFQYYKAFAAELAKQGFITYSPQNPYRGKDRFRTIQRKSNLLKRSLFSYIVPQHRQTVRWLGSLPYVDASRIAFYGLSYGGKTAVRVPPLVDEYCLSICSGDFDEWILKIGINSERYSYLFYGEYEIFEWDMANIANYAELASLMTPRPFMVERGHNDGVAPDEWVAAEYSKVRRHYNQMGLGDKTTIEYFDGPHCINAVGTFEFLQKHLKFKPLK